MADTTSALLQLLLMADGGHDGDWGDRTNENLGKLENAISGSSNIDMSGGAVVLSTDQARPAILFLTGALPANETLTFPARTGVWIVVNQTTGAYAASLVSAGGGAAVSMLQGDIVTVFSDGAKLTSANASQFPLGVVEEYYGLKLPSARYLWANGATVSRAAYPGLFAALSDTTTGTAGNASTALTTADDLSGDGIVGATVEAVGIPAGTTVTAIAGTNVTLSAATIAALAAGTAVRFLPYGQGDGATTFVLPNRGQRAAVGRATMGGAADPGVITAATIANVNNLNARGGAETASLSVAQMPAHGHGVSDPGHAHGASQDSHNHGFTAGFPTGGVSGSYYGACSLGGGSTDYRQPNVYISSAATGLSVQSTGGGSPHTNLQPTMVCNFIIRALP